MDFEQEAKLREHLELLMKDFPNTSIFISVVDDETGHAAFDLFGCPRCFGEGFANGTLIKMLLSQKHTREHDKEGVH